MALISAEIKFSEIFRTMPVQLYFPTDLPAEVGNKVNGVITLLHGMGNTGKDWMQMTAACRYAADNGFILVAPDADNSFYADTAYGAPFYTALTQLLPYHLGNIFRIPQNRECNYLAGLSMGGYGALQIGLKNPSRYAAIGSFSGVVDLRYSLEKHKDPAVVPLMQGILGPQLQLPDEYDLFRLAENVSALPAEEQPRLFCTCGAQDEFFEIYEQNMHFKKHAESLPLNYTFQSWNGVHEWNFWDRSLAEFIGFVRGNDYGRRKCGDWSAPFLS